MARQTFIPFHLIKRNPLFSPPIILSLFLFASLTKPLCFFFLPQPNLLSLHFTLLFHYGDNCYSYYFRTQHSTPLIPLLLRHTLLSLLLLFLLLPLN
ncbi:hypothetical protein JHK87_040265 [Glycine soja]|nr:hypothetical protein JHK87_040265 [Glycine soja]